jgi:WD40 repeat protein
MGIHENAIQDFKKARTRVLAGSYTWFLSLPEFISWSLDENIRSGPSIFWISGMPAAGKTAIASVVIERLGNQHNGCQFHFFAAGHQTKRTVAYCLRSIATQLALINDNLRTRLISLETEAGIRFNSQDPNLHAIWEQIYEQIIFKIDFGRPLFWVLDGVDESDSQDFFANHLANFESITPIKVFLTSRPTKLSISTISFGSTSTMFCLTESHTKQDVRGYITSQISEALADDKKVQEDLIDQVLSKASGSFLWVRLALESLKDDCHTHDDIRRILTEIPMGMIPLYDRMLESIKSQSPRAQHLASRILTWVACSWRPLTSNELELALKTEFGNFTKFEDTVNQVCGHFVSVVDGQVTLIHATARQFLTEDRNGCPAFVHERQGHERIALACLQHLSQDHWRRVFQTYSAGPAEPTGSKTNRLLLLEQGHPLLGYATCYWAYHVLRSSCHSFDIISALRLFFNNYCLSWIEAIALSANMGYLIRSAKYLRAYAKLMRCRSATSDTLTSLKRVDEEDAQWIHGWATDCIRIVGKFGSSLVSMPSSIHRDIPPFCPTGSMIGRMYGEPRPGFLSVSGISFDGWDDCLANVSVGENVIASRVLAADSHFINLVNSSNQIIMWYAETCQKAKVINVEGHIHALCLNKSGTFLATSSFTTYSVWEISTGRPVYQIPKLSNAIVKFIAFQEDTRLLIGTDDQIVTVLDVSQNLELSQSTFNAPPDCDGCPFVMEISPDLKKVGLAWRGKLPMVWDLDSPKYQSLQRCRIRNSVESLFAPESLLWHPDIFSLFILCQDMNLVEWNIFEERQIAYPHVEARQITFNREGSLLLSCNTSGTISVWGYPRLALVYQLSCENDFVRDIAFSPDSQRLYDTRGSLCNVWEPDALIRLDTHELDDHSSIGDQSFPATEPMVSYYNSDQSPVTALGTSFGDEYYCCGREDGTVAIHDITDGRRLRKVYSHSSSSTVLSISWSPSGRFMVSYDDSARIIVKRLEVKGSGKWAVYPVIDSRLPEPPQQLVFDPKDQYLLVSGRSADIVYGLKKKEIFHKEVQGVTQNRLWIQDPTENSLLIRVSPSKISFHVWETLQEQRSFSLCSASGRQELDGGPPTNVIFWVTYLKEKNRLIYATVPDDDHQMHISFLSHSALHIEVVDMFSSLELVDEKVLECKHEFTSQVKRLIGNYEGKIVFLDHEYWLCSWQLDEVKGVKKHFVLPKDWLNADSLQIALINDYGTFLCPKFGAVAAVRNGIIP